MRFKWNSLLMCRTETIVKRIVLGTGQNVRMAARATDPFYSCKELNQFMR